MFHWIVCSVSMYQESIFHSRIKLFSAREPRNRSRNVCGNVETYLQLLFFCSVAAYCLIWYRFIVSAGRSPLTNIHHRKCRCVGVPLLHLGRSYISWHLLHKVPRYPLHLYQLPRHNRVASHIYLGTFALISSSSLHPPCHHDFFKFAPGNDLGTYLGIRNSFFW